MRDSLICEFESPDQLASAIDVVKRMDHALLRAYGPYQSDAVEEALGLRRSSLPKVCCAVGFTAALGAYLLQWLLEAYLYPLNVGGRPPHAPLSFLVITFEMGVLAAGLTAFFGVFATSKLPLLYHPIDEIDGFGRVSDDRFWLVLSEVDDEQAKTMVERLQELEPARMVRLEGGRAP